MSVVFTDPQLQSAFEEEGYVIVDFLNVEQANNLANSYAVLATETNKNSNSPTGSHETEISIFNRDKIFTKAVHQEIVDAFKSKTDEYLNDYVPIMGNMVYKNPLETKDFSLHQDWSFTNENQHTAVNIWSPLVDTDKNNGTLHIIKRSHLFQNNTIRGANIGDASNKISDFIKEHFGTGIVLKLGQAIIMNTQLYHFSPPNRSGLARPAALLAMLPKSAEMFFYYKNPKEGSNNSAIEKFKIDAEFMTRFHVDRAPEGVNKIETFDYKIDYFTKESFTELYKNYNKQLPQSLNYKEGKRIVFRDAKIQQHFEREGYVVIDLLDQSEVDALRTNYETLSQQLKGNLQMISIYDRNKEFTTAVNKEISSLFGKKLKTILVDYKSIIGYFVYKQPQQTDDLEIHQDASFSDESIHTTINIWCPLVDTNNENGALHIIEKSHLFAPSIRGFKIGYAVDKIREFVKKYFASSIPIKAGQAIIMNTQMYHFSPPNRTEVSRPAAVLAMLPKEAPIYMYYTHPEKTNKSGQIEHFEIEDKFLVQEFNVHEVPKGQKSLGMVDYQLDYFTMESFMQLYKKYNHVLPLKARVKSVISKILNR